MPDRVRLEPRDHARARPYRWVMSEESSKRIDDLRKRFDDLRGDVDRRFGDLRGDINRRVGEVRDETNHRFDGVDRRFTGMSQKLTTFMWIVSGWFTFLSALLALFGFLRL